MWRGVVRTIQYGLWLFVALAVVCCGIIGYARVEGLTLLSVQTASMRPALRPGDVVLTTPLNSDVAVRKGDIVSYRSLANSDILITHRVISYNRITGQATTKGDALQEPDPPFGQERIVGRVVRTVPMAGYGLDVLRRPLGLVLAVYIPSVILIYGEIRRLMQHYDSQHYRLHVYFDS